MLELEQLYAVNQRAERVGRLIACNLLLDGVSSWKGMSFRGSLVENCCFTFAIFVVTTFYFALIALQETRGRLGWRGEYIA